MLRNAVTRTDLDVAVGVLVGRRHCSRKAAFSELAQAARDTGIGVSALSRALVELASGDAGRFDHRDEVAARWADLLGLSDLCHPA
ncbi:ANTAR domain-containing protein [Mycobacterium sp. Y57]|uniref:ANTAR domain-containing protein n=1 Tax=Mycolicibacterium xanthum TaxID=2796469 RepID=UPI001C846CBC|nr:ANTAR domain-containing protein [Mycolicibacterium xanthum]MBX7432149.1 ANTAR domain-containing protein [Mycolicibacterium xanthum]